MRFSEDLVALSLFWTKISTFMKFIKKMNFYKENIRATERR